MIAHAHGGVHVPAREREAQRGRSLKRTVRRLLCSDPFEEGLDALLRLPLRRVVSPLISHFYSPRDEVRWRSITAVGRVVAVLAGQDPEAARVMVRRLMWSLNEESGGIGWGAPEALGEILAQRQDLAREYASILVSYAIEGANHLEHPELQKGVVWAIGRLAQVRPDLVRDALPAAVLHCASNDAVLRGTAVWSLGWMQDPRPRTALEGLVEDHTPLRMWIEDRLVFRTVGNLAMEALRRIGLNACQGSRREAGGG